MLYITKYIYSLTAETQNDGSRSISPIRVVANKIKTRGTKLSMVDSDFFVHFRLVFVLLRYRVYLSWNRMLLRLLFILRSTAWTVLWWVYIKVKWQAVVPRRCLHIVGELVVTKRQRVVYSNCRAYGERAFTVSNTLFLTFDLPRSFVLLLLPQMWNFIHKPWCNISFVFLRW